MRLRKTADRHEKTIVNEVLGIITKVLRETDRHSDRDCQGGKHRDRDRRRDSWNSSKPRKEKKRKKTEKMPS